MADLRLVAAPTFETPVEIPVHGKEAVEVDFTFKHRTKDEVAKWRDELKGKTDGQVILEMVEAWQFEDDLNLKNAETLTQNYAGAATAILTTYLKELAQARIKN
jgi:hypothetical protein